MNIQRFLRIFWLNFTMFSVYITLRPCFTDEVYCDAPACLTISEKYFKGTLKINFILVRNCLRPKMDVSVLKNIRPWISVGKFV